MNSYELSRCWFNFCFDNPEKIKPNHSALYFFAIEHCNRLGWKKKFGFPSQMVMEALGIRNWKTYSKTLYDLEDFGFIKVVEKSKNQYSSNIIAIVKNTKAHTKALDKALSKHVPKQGTKQGQSIVSIIKQYNKEQLTTIKAEVDKLYFTYEKDKQENIKTIYEVFVYEIKNGNFDTRVEALYRNIKTKKGSLTSLLKEYQDHLISENRLHKNTNEFFVNFKNWLNVQDRLGKLDKFR